MFPMTTDAPIATSSAPAPADAARVVEGRLVDQCPACAYSLEGLPDEGICPECGGRYDQSLMVLHGTACGQLASLANISLGRLAWRLGGLVAVAVYFGRRVGFAVRDPVMLLLVGLVAALVVLSLVRRFGAAQAQLVQVYL